MPRILEIRSRHRVDAISNTSFAALAAAGVQSERLSNPKTTATPVLELREVPRERKAVQPQSVAAFRSRN